MANVKLAYQDRTGKTLVAVVPDLLFVRRGFFAALLYPKSRTMSPIIDIYRKRNFVSVCLFGLEFIFGRPLSGGKTFRRAKWQVVG